MPSYHRLAILALCLACYVSAQGRWPRQWAFPDDSPTTQRPFPPRTTQRTTTTRRQNVVGDQTTTTRRQNVVGDQTTTQAPSVIFNVPNCDCPSPPQFNPVCASDGNTYGNIQKLNCARMCGSSIQLVRMGACTTPRK